MKFLCLIFIFLTSFIYADISVEKVFSISFDRNTQTQILSDVAKGIDNFYLSEEVFLLKSGDNQVLRYTKEGQLIEIIDIPSFAMDLAVHENNLYIITTTQEIHKISLLSRNQGSSFVEHSLPQQIQLIKGFPVIHLANGYTSIGDFCEKGWRFSPSTSVFTEKTDNYRGTITVIANGQEKSHEVSFEKELATILPIGFVNKNLYVKVELVDSVSPLKISEKIITWNTDSHNQIEETSIPQVQYNFTYGSYKNIDGNIYKIMITPEGIDILLISSENRAVSLQSLYPLEYHYNDNLQFCEEVEGEKNDEASSEDIAITREQIIRNAEKFLNVSWSANSKNKSGGIIDVGGAKIQTPEWVTSGTHYKMPYKWGGFTSVDTFLSKVAQGKYAGDRYTKSVSWGDTYCVSVDCSGFVSRAWNTSQKYGTSTIEQVSNRYNSISSLKRGDALNNKGSHIVLVVENNPSGTVNVIESSGMDWAVSKRTRNFSSLKGYVPIYYKYISGGNSPDKGTLKGVIFDAAKGSSSRLSGATVTLNNGNSITTSSDGVYSFSVSAGTYTIKVTKSGYSSSPISRDVKSGETAWGSVGMNK